jgi:activator of HSP90 ATPase
MSYDFELSCTLPASPAEIYEAWLSSAGHSAMTGSFAKTSKKAGAAHSAWDGYIIGKNVELTPGEKIVQTWRTSEFADNDPDSTITLTLTPLKSGARVTLRHSGVPDGQTSYERHGWKEFYFEPMQAYLASRAKAAETAGGKNQ